MQTLDALMGEAARGAVTRRQFVRRALGLGLSASTAALLAASCGSRTESVPAKRTVTDTAKPDKLYILNWQNELAPANKAKFQKRYGIEIVETYFTDNEMLVEKMRSGATGFDIVVPGGYAVAELIRFGQLQPLELRLLPNLKNLSADFRAPVYDPGAGGRRYSVPFVWGTSGIAVRTDKMARPVDGWSALWDESNAGRIDMMADMRETIGAALLLLGTSINATSQTPLEAAQAKLLEQKPLVRAYDTLGMRRHILAGVPLVHSWDGDAYMAAERLPAGTVDYVLPKEGFNIWVDNLCVPTGARSAFGAHLFIDFMLEPRNAADLVDYLRYQSPNEAARPLIDPSLLAQAPSPDELARGQMMSDVGAALQKYQDVWIEVTGA